MGSLFFEKMKEYRILYLKQTLFEANAYTTHGVNEINSLKNEINKLAVRHFFSIESYRNGVRKYLPLKNKIPIRYSNKLFLFYIKIKQDESYYINYYSILKICFNEKVVIIFKNGEILELNIPVKVILKEIRKVEIISNYLNNL